VYKNNNKRNIMANIYLHWMKEISERRNIYIDLDLNKDIIY